MTFADRRKKNMVGIFYQTWMFFFWPVSNLVQRAQPSKNKLFHKCFTIITQFQYIIFICNEFEKTNLNRSPISKTRFLSIHSSRILSAWIMKNESYSSHNYLQDMLVNIIRNLKISSRMFVITTWITNTAIVTAPALLKLIECQSPHILFKHLFCSTCLLTKEG